MLVAGDVRLRAVEKEDLPRFTTWLNDPEVSEHLLIYLPLSMAEEEQWFESVLHRPKDERPLVIEISTLEGWIPVGNIGLHNLDWRVRSAEIGLFIGDKSHWNQGWGRKVLRLILRHCFQTLNLNRVFLQVFATNERGIRAYEHAGFIHEGRLRQATYQNGQFVDILVMSVLRSEWQDILD